MINKIKIRRITTIFIVMLIILIVGSPFTNANTLKLTNKKILKSGDEGSHFHRFLSVKEWWYFNIVFDKQDSELRNWSAMISFHHMCKNFEKPDFLIISLYDDGNKTYGGVIEKDKGTLKAEKYGVNISFENSTVKGGYPNWYLHAEDEDADNDHEIIVDLHFKAECTPYWVGLNTGLGNPRSPFGYYSINHCHVTGNVTIDNDTYQVNGSGYHDHLWALYVIGGRASFFWDWFSIHFDNGYHAFIWEILPGSNFIFKSFKPKICWITDGENFTDFYIFKLERLEYENTSIPDFERPKLFHLTFRSLRSKIDLYLETKNMHEYLWKSTTDFDIALWEGSCLVNGTITIGNEETEVKGWAISEILRIF
jgi:hypothetical protein